LKHNDRRSDESDKGQSGSPRPVCGLAAVSDIRALHEAAAGDDGVPQGVLRDSRPLRTQEDKETHHILPTADRQVRSEFKASPGIPARDEPRRQDNHRLVQRRPSEELQQGRAEDSELPRIQGRVPRHLLQLGQGEDGQRVPVQLRGERTRGA